MNTTNQQTTDCRITDYRTQGPQATDHSQPAKHAYALRRDGGYWQLTFEGRQSIFTHELGALYVAYLLGEPPQEPIHGVALALKAREKLGQPANSAEALQQQVMGLEEGAAVRALWRRQGELERVLADRLVIEPVKAEAQRELEEITEHLRQSPWLSRDGAGRCARAVGVAIKRLQARLAAAVDAEGRPDRVLRAFALHLLEYLLVPSGQGGTYAREQAVPGFEGCFSYQARKGVAWKVNRGQKSEDRGQESEDRGQKSEDRGQKSEDRGQRTEDRGAAAVGYLSRFLCVGFAMALLGSGCAGPGSLRGGRAITTLKPAGGIEQTLVQGENPSQATKQDHETVKVRTYTVPAGSRVEETSASASHDPQYERNDLLSRSLSPSKGERVPKAGEGARQPSTRNSQHSTAFFLSAPMPVVEREETRARTELGAAQKDTARELGARLSSLKGIVWVGVGLFVFGLGSLVWPPLKVIVGSVTTSAALMLGGVALMVLPGMIVGNELLILGVVALAVGGWFLAHRHGQLRGQVAASAGAQTPGSNQSSVTSDQSSVTSDQSSVTSDQSSVASDQ